MNFFVRNVIVLFIVVMGMLFKPSNVMVYGVSISNIETNFPSPGNSMVPINGDDLGMPQVPGNVINDASAAFTNTISPTNIRQTMDKMTSQINDMATFVQSLGIPDIPNIIECRKYQALAEELLCVQIMTRKYTKIFYMAKEIATLNSRIASGGSSSNMALTRLKTLASSSIGRSMMKSLGTTLACTVLMQKESTSDRTRWLAGSMLTLITNLPTASALSDVKSGGFGHINIVLPRLKRIHQSDEIIHQLRHGIDPADTEFGGFGVESRYDV